MPHAQMPIRRMSKKITSECKQYANFLLTMYLYCKNLEIDIGPARVPLLSLGQDKLDAHDCAQFAKLNKEFRKFGMAKM